MPKLRNGSRWESNPGSVDCESGIQPRSTRYPFVVSYTSKIPVRWPGQCYGFTLSLIFKYCGGI